MGGGERKTHKTSKKKKSYLINRLETKLATVSGRLAAGHWVGVSDPAGRPKRQPTGRQRYCNQFEPLTIRYDQYDQLSQQEGHSVAPQTGTHSERNMWAASPTGPLTKYTIG